MFIRTRLVRLITFGFAAAITLFPFVLIRPEVSVNRRIVIHERIHLKQQAELLIIPFYILYLLEYLYRLFRYRNHYTAYRQISFEREAYENEADTSYLSKRRWWNWRKYL